MVFSSSLICMLLAVSTFFLRLCACSKASLVSLPRGMTYALSTNVIRAIIPADTMYGFIRRLKLTPDANMAITSELSASFEVKYITEMNTNRALNVFA